MELGEVFEKCISDKDVLEINPIALAFIGDGVHTLFVRDKVIKSDNLLLKNYHRQSALYCNAKKQASEMEKILQYLNEDELYIIKRTRNSKIHHTAKNSDEKTYKMATCFEALIGYLYLTGKYDRLNEILKIN